MGYPNARDWKEDDVAQLKELWHDGVPVKEMAVLLKRTPASVRRYVEVHRDRLQLGKRNRVQCALKGQKEYWDAKRKAKTFDNAWHGDVPFGHWMITQPWGKTNG